MVIKENPKPARLLQEAWSLFQAGELNKAGDLYTGITQLKNPQHLPAIADAWHMLGVIELQRGHHSLAVNHIRKAVQINPHNADFHNNLAVAYRKTGMIEEAKKSLKISRDKKRETQQQQYRNYQDIFLKRRETPYMKYPFHVHMETLALCNASCEFCPYSTLERRGTKMPDSLIDKIIDDLTAIPSDVAFQLSPFKVNEPLLDKRLYKILEKINIRLPHAHLTLTTNASILNEKHLEKLCRVGNIHYLWVSLNEHRPQQYRQVMNLPYEKTINNLNRIHAWKGQGKIPFNIMLARVSTDCQEDIAFRDWVSRQYPLFLSCIVPRGDWLGQVQRKFECQIPDVGCIHWFELSITATGKVAHCCMDGHCRYPIGDVNTTHILDIYNAPSFRKLRESADSRLHAPVCRSCNFL